MSLDHPTVERSIILARQVVDGVQTSVSPTVQQGFGMPERFQIAVRRAFRMPERFQIAARRAFGTLEDLSGSLQLNLSASRVPRPSTIQDNSRLPCELEQIPVIQMIHSGKDEDSIIHSVLGKGAQISIDAMDKVCSTFAHHQIRELKLVLSIRQ